MTHYSEQIEADRESDGIALMLGDFLERMKEIPDGSVDMILTVCYY